MRVVLCIPTVHEPFPQTKAAVAAAADPLRDAGHHVGILHEVGSAYVSWARANMTRKALVWGAEAMVYIDHDLSFPPEDLIRLIETPGDVVAGNYRFKDDTGDYMGIPLIENGRIGYRKDGCIRAKLVPAGFLKVTRAAVERIREAHPELICDDPTTGERFVDIFHHGAYRGVWWGEDYAFSRRWREMGGTVWMQPDFRISHWLRKGDEYTEFPGHYLAHLQDDHVAAADARAAA